jgi:2-phospho-L-lactate transferase/gluconeogenesis factor (CofD/UPF0052 family)
MSDRRTLSVVLFSGGRGSSVLSRELLNHPDIALTVAINGYDDGLSTGEVRRFLGDSLGPSDFRKNASILAEGLHSCPPELIELLDLRLPAACSKARALTLFRLVESSPGPEAAGQVEESLTRLALSLAERDRRAVVERLAQFEAELESSGKVFDFSDCSLGNLVFAGSFLRQGRRFNESVDDYCSILGLPTGLIENVTDGTNAFLVALDPNGRLLASEAEIVDANRRNRIADIYLLDGPVPPELRQALAARPAAEVVSWLEARERTVSINSRLLEPLRNADLIIYSPGTQHSSLFPSYLSSGLSTAIARNLTAVKLLITNIQSDAELADTTAVDIVEKAVYYLREKGRVSLPTPCLITHYVINDPRRSAEESPYVPLGRLESLEDPRLIRISNYEDGVTGRHDPTKVLTPFLRSLLTRPSRQKVAVWLYDSGSTNKVSQTVLEMVRAGVQDLLLDLTVFYGGVEQLDHAFTTMLPFAMRYVGRGGPIEAIFQRALSDEAFDYAILFESSGMYNGEDLVSVAAPLGFGRLDAVWGSRRLSVRDIEASLRVRYRHHTWLRILSVIGSHVLSAAYLLLYGRYVSDTLSGVRAIRASYVAASDVDLCHKLLNQRLLSRLLGYRAELLETPVRFYAMSPQQVRRTSVFEGLQSLAMILWWRLRSDARKSVSATAPKERDLQAPLT